MRWRFVPQSGEKQLSEAELENLPANFLEQNLIKRTEEGAVKEVVPLIRTTCLGVIFPVNHAAINGMMVS